MNDKLELTYIGCIGVKFNRTSECTVYHNRIQYVLSQFVRNYKPLSTEVRHMEMMKYACTVAAQFMLSYELLSSILRMK